jgi:hypothetical protein
MTIRVVPDAGPTGEVHGAFVLMNVSTAKQAQEALRASKPSSDSSWTTFRRCKMVVPEPAQRGMAGESRKDLTGRKVAEVQQIIAMQPLLACFQGRSRGDGADARKPSGDPLGIDHCARTGMAGQGDRLRGPPTRQKNNEDALRRQLDHCRPVTIRRWRCWNG